MKNLIAEVLTLKILKDYRIKDNIDAMRVHMMCIEVAKNPSITLEEWKDTPGFRSTVNDISFTDEYLTELLSEILSTKNQMKRNFDSLIKWEKNKYWYFKYLKVLENGDKFYLLGHHYCDGCMSGRCTFYSDTGDADEIPNRIRIYRDSILVFNKKIKKNRKTQLHDLNFKFEDAIEFAKENGYTF